MVERAVGDVPGQPRRLWVTFQTGMPPVFGNTGGYLGDVILSGCGVTGLDEEDCWRRVRGVFGERPLPEVRDVVLDIDVSTLDPDRVLSGIGNPAVLGVWFPRTIA
ncbi:MAG TPA: hypothetical protein VGN51_19275 [Acidimicrobiia bacterium]